MRFRVGFKTVVHTFDAWKTKSINECIDRIHLLPNRIEQDTRYPRGNVQRDPRKASASSHIKKSGYTIPDIRNEQKRVQDMENESLIEISDAREIDIGIDLDNIKEMPNTHFNLGVRQIEFGRDQKLFERRAQLMKLFLFDIDMLQDNLAFRHFSTNLFL